MDNLKNMLLQRIRTIDGVQDQPSPVSGGTALFYRGKPFAHFHDNNEIDLRLTKKVIQAQGLTHPAGSVHHPERSPDSPWIEVRFTSTGDVERTAELIRLAIAEL